jgi:hypothetical protein
MEYPDEFQRRLSLARERAPLGRPDQLAEPFHFGETGECVVDERLEVGPVF